MRPIAITAVLAAMFCAQAAHATNNVTFGKDNDCLYGEAAAFDSEVATTANCNYGQACKNDQARSVIVTDTVKAGTIIRVWDSPDGSAKDDWAEIIIKSFVKNSRYGMCIRSFETSRSGADFEVIYHRVNGLDGKVSRIQIIPAPAPKAPPVLRTRGFPRKTF